MGILYSFAFSVIRSASRARKFDVEEMGDCAFCASAINALFDTVPAALAFAILPPTKFTPFTDL
jgi:hypothetical protein